MIYLFAQSVTEHQSILYIICVAMMTAIGKLWWDLRAIDKDHADCRVENEKLKGEIAVLRKDYRNMRGELDALKVQHYSAVNDEGAFFTANGDGVIVLWSPDVAKLTGWTEPEMLGKPVFQIIPERYHDLHHAQLSAIASGHKKLARHFVDKSFVETKSGMEVPITTEVRSYRVYRPETNDYTWYFRVTLEERAATRPDSDVILPEKGPNST